MTPAYYLVLVLVSLLSITLAIPIHENDDTNSVGQHLGRAGLWLFGGLAGIGMAIGSISYGTSCVSHLEVALSGLRPCYVRAISNIKGQINGRICGCYLREC
jgi:hypothetical protein